jgi:beta-lactamase regulating signal transducer with metallopeptidase domain
VAHARVVSPGSHSAFQSACHHVGISSCRILELPGLHSPGTAYTWKPLVLLPEGLDLYLDSEQLIDVLCHELIHIRRLDFFWNTVAELVGVALFFHPAIWLALSKLGPERELASDEAVVELRQGRRTDYAYASRDWRGDAFLVVNLRRPRIWHCWTLGASCANLAERKSSKDLVEARRRDFHQRPCPVTILCRMVNPLSRH